MTQNTYLRVDSERGGVGCASAGANKHCQRRDLCRDEYGVGKDVYLAGLISSGAFLTLALAAGGVFFSAPPAQSNGLF
jgi:hypothetical protein